MTFFSFFTLRLYLPMLLFCVSFAAAAAKEEDTTSDWDKLQLALAPLLHYWRNKDGSDTSTSSLLQVLGLASLPAAQRTGILLGAGTFVTTVAAVLLLLYCGGTFARIAQEEEAQSSSGNMSLAERSAQRPLLYETLLEQRARFMMEYEEADEVAKPKNGTTTPTTNHTNDTTTTTTTVLMRRLQNVAPTQPPTPTYQQLYQHAYRQCQDRPGGPTLPGRPEARYEAYARAYAGCARSDGATSTYRRSYARLYEAIVCANLPSDQDYTRLFGERPHDVVGRSVRLEALERTRHAAALWAATNGTPTRDYHKSYDPLTVWCFADVSGSPFDSVEALRQSELFASSSNANNPTTAAWVIRSPAALAPEETSTGVLGLVRLSHDAPQHLSIQMSLPILSPGCTFTSRECLEACFLLLDRLFGLGYRRVYAWVDPLDGPGRQFLSRHLGMTLEGRLYKHRIVQDASRDDCVYALLNSDWNGPVRAVLYPKLYGAAAWRADQRQERIEREREEQARVLQEQQKEAREVFLSNEEENGNGGKQDDGKKKV